jgi:hypothetical protein
MIQGGAVKFSSDAFIVRIVLSDNNLTEPKIGIDKRNHYPLQNRWQLKRRERNQNQRRSNNSFLFFLELLLLTEHRDMNWKIL